MADSSLQRTIVRSVDPVGPGDLAAALELHARCSPATLRERYGVADRAEADRLLPHLLSHRFGHSVAARDRDGALAGLGQLLWDGEGDEVELALLVPDARQRRGVGTALLGRLLTVAAGAGFTEVYAVTTTGGSGERGVFGLLRAAGLTVDRYEDGGSVVLSAPLASRPLPTPLGPATVR
ncbi:GNAT family N-acetyltransferase [Streptomyces carpaticus]|uniref:N-acetyltransferase family protein n=1 Tax=Streptomyces carpaticus TaxID=285558 RepID=A0ABV4ZQ95_9ACTN